VDGDTVVTATWVTACVVVDVLVVAVDAGDVNSGGGLSASAGVVRLGDRGLPAGPGIGNVLPAS